MTERVSIRRRTGAHMRALLLAAAFLSPAPFIMPGVITPAQAQVGIRAEFREALGPYGRWEHHRRWGDVWVPSDVDRGWRPYTVGRWAYTNDWGWYWVSDQPEEVWGWVVYHYGRWVDDADLGWVWIPGDRWAPAWVEWRRGARHIGWAPLPPEEVIVEYRDRPDFWIFCRAQDFTVGNLARVVVPVREYDVFFRDTVVVNRTYEFRNYGYAVDTGIAPNVVAAFVGRPIRTFDVRPLVLAGTARIPGAVEVRNEWLREGRRDEFLRQAAVSETSRTITPANRIPPPQPLAAGERGRLGQNPPRAAQGTSALGQGQPQGTQGRATTPEEQRPGRQPQQGKEFGREQGKQPTGPGARQPQGTQGRATTPEEQRPSRQPQGKEFGREQEQGKQPPGPGARGPQGTQGRGATTEEPRPGRQPQGKEFGGEQGKEQPGVRQAPGTEGRGPTGEERRRARQPQGAFQEQGRGPRGEQRTPGTERRGNVEPRGVEPRGATRGTESRGGALERGPQGRGIEQRPSGTEGRGGELRRENRPAPNAGTERRGLQAGAERRGPEMGTVGRGGGPQGGFERRGGAEARGAGPAGGGGPRVDGGAGPRGGGGPRVEGGAARAAAVVVGQEGAGRGAASSGENPITPRINERAARAACFFARGSYFNARISTEPQHRLYFSPLPHGQGSLRPIFVLRTACRVSAPLARGGETHGSVKSKNRRRKGGDAFGATSPPFRPV
jgi:hypothetical protein